ncbi:MAG: tail fiber domain-containing protein [Fimbriimonadales bacterium]|nr:tail fiber domain-containing protein [Fimbriimonadales bacterium]
MQRKTLFGMCVWLALTLASHVVAQPFTYQGFLKQNGQPVNGTRSMTFKLFTALTNGSQVGGAITQNVNVQNGLFTVELNFGNVWDGSNRYLEISVDGNTLSPRVKINPAPYASTAFYAQRPWQTAGSNIFYAGGNVGIGTNSPQGDLHVRSLSAEQLDQETATAFRTGIPGFTWQSFTPAITGVLTKVAVYLDAVNPISLTIRVYQGEGTGGVLLAERTVTPGNFTGWHEVAIGDVNLTAGQRYTVEVMPNGLFIAADNQNPYPNGRSGAGVQFDLLLRTYMALPVESLVVRQGAVGIGTTTPSARLHLVNGNLRVDDGEIQSWGPITIHADVDNTGDDVVRFVDSTGNETMRIHSNGRVGIGTSTPLAPLSFSNTTGNKIALWGQSDSHYGIGIQASLLQIYTDQAGSDVAFGFGSSSNFTERARIKGSGLSVAVIPGNNGQARTDWPTGWNGGIATWDINASGILATEYRTRSDERLKRDIQPLDTASELQRLLSLRPVSYYWRDERLPQTLQYGFIAQELREVFPELVLEGTDEDRTLSVNYQALIPLLVNALQAQQAEIQQLRNEVQQLRARLNQKP